MIPGKKDFEQLVAVGYRRGYTAAVRSLMEKLPKTTENLIVLAAEIGSV